MSKRRAPKLPSGAGRARYQEFVADVRKFARSEFQAGASETDVYARVVGDGIPLPALRAVISREYLAHLGVTDANLRGVRFAAMVAAFLAYGLFSSFFPMGQPVFRYGIPTVLAIAVFVGSENLGHRLLRVRKSRRA